MVHCQSGKCRVPLGGKTLTCTKPAPEEGTEGAYCNMDGECTLSQCCQQDTNKCASDIERKKVNTGEHCICNSQCRTGKYAEGIIRNEIPGKCEKLGGLGNLLSGQHGMWRCTRVSESDADIAEAVGAVGEQCRHDTVCESQCCDLNHLKHRDRKCQTLNTTGIHLLKPGTKCRCDMECESRKCDGWVPKIRGARCAELTPEENVAMKSDGKLKKSAVKKGNAFLGRLSGAIKEAFKAAADEKRRMEEAQTKLFDTLWLERNDLRAFGAEGQPCVTPAMASMGTASCPVGQRCTTSSSAVTEGTCAPDWEHQRFTFGVWKGAKLTWSERLTGNYRYGDHKGCIKRDECWSGHQKWYANADPDLPDNWWRSETTIKDAIAKKGARPGWLVHGKGGGYGKINFDQLSNPAFHKLMPGQFCGDDERCKMYCVDATNYDSGHYCWEIKKPQPCRASVLPPCRGLLQCMSDENSINTCEDLESEKGKKLIAIQEKKDMEVNIDR
jgi:hypothetical protein